MTNNKIMFISALIALIGFPGHLARAEISTDAPASISVDVQRTVNPFAPDQKVRFVRIIVNVSDTGITYAINDRPMTADALDTALGRLAAIDRNQIIAIEPQSDVTLDEMSPLMKMLKKHKFKNVARKGDDNRAIWITE